MLFARLNRLQKYRQPNISCVRSFENRSPSELTLLSPRGLPCSRTSTLDHFGLSNIAGLFEYSATPIPATFRESALHAVHDNPHLKLTTLIQPRLLSHLYWEALQRTMERASIVRSRGESTSLDHK